jgi:hypothetical protein
MTPVKGKRCTKAPNCGTPHPTRLNPFSTNQFVPFRFHIYHNKAFEATRKCNGNLTPTKYKQFILLFEKVLSMYRKLDAICKHIRTPRIPADVATAQNGRKKAATRRMNTF